MRMNKKAIIVATTFATSLILVACGNDTTDEDTMTPMESSSEIIQSSDQIDTSSMTESESSTMSSMDSSSESSDRSTSTEGIETTTFDVSMQQAVDKFMETYPDAKMTSIAIDKESNEYVYEVGGFNDKNEVEVSVDAMSGEIVRQDMDDRDDVIDDDILDIKGIVTPEEAMKAALDKVGNGYAKEWELDSKDGKIYYEVDVEGSDKDGDDVHIDAKTGDFIGFD